LIFLIFLTSLKNFFISLYYWRFYFLAVGAPS
jgi:hypothetical protein